MITGAQVRGARGILDWSADILAEKTGLSVDTIRNIEKGRVQGHNTSLEKIVQVFANSGLEFIENQGVRFKPTGVTIYDGVAAFEDFHEFLYLHLKQNGGDVCLSMYDEPLLAKYRKDPEIHRGRMRELVGGGNVSFRILTTNSSWNTRGYIQFKWLPHQRPVPTGFYAFGDCLALMSFVNPQSPYVVVLQSGPITEAYRQGFDIAWDSAEEPPSKGTDE